MVVGGNVSHYGSLIRHCSVGQICSSMFSIKRKVKQPMQLNSFSFIIMHYYHYAACLQNSRWSNSELSLLRWFISLLGIVLVLISQPTHFVRCCASTWNYVWSIWILILLKVYSYMHRIDLNPFPRYNLHLIWLWSHSISSVDMAIKSSITVLNQDESNFTQSNCQSLTVVYSKLKHVKHTQKPREDETYIPPLRFH